MNKSKNDKFEKQSVMIATIIILIIIIVSIIYMYITGFPDKNNSNNGLIIGGDKDHDDCLIGAGYTWCEEKQKCLRIWEEPCINDYSQTKLETYIKENISALSPKKEVLGGKFYVTEILLIDNDKVHIEYEDGHNSYIGKANFEIKNEEVMISSFKLIEENKSASIDDANISKELAGLLAKKYDKKTEEVEVIIVDYSGKLVKGRVNFTPLEQPGNAGIFYAVQTDGQWQIIFDGNGLPKCIDTDKYGFPENMLSGCINEHGELRENNWELIKNAIINCQAKEVMQSHSQYVTATLKNDDKLEGVEPEIDDIIDLSIAYQEKCGKIIMATE